MGDGIKDYADHLKPNCSISQKCNECSNYKCEYSKSELAEMCRKLDFIAQKNIELADCYKKLHESAKMKIQEEKDRAEKLFKSKQEIFIAWTRDKNSVSLNQVNLEIQIRGLKKEIENDSRLYNEIINKKNDFIEELAGASERFMDYHTKGQRYRSRIPGYHTLKVLVNKVTRGNF